ETDAADTDTVRVTSATVTGLGAVGVFAMPQATPGSSERSLPGLVVTATGQPLVTSDASVVGGGQVIFGTLGGPTGFGPPVPIARTNVDHQMPIPPQDKRGVGPDPNLAIDHSGKRYNGRIYLTYTDSPAVGSTDTNIFVRYSDDNGNTWSPPVRVNDDTTQN